MKKSGYIILAAAVLILALAAGCGLYLGDYYRADETALLALKPDAEITVQKSDSTLVFAPDSPSAGLIFYPGGKVEHTAYAPLMRGLAERGVLCVLVKMPLNLAVLDMDAAEGIPEAYPGIERWYLGGHSLGGSMAASYASGNAEDFEGLVLLAAYSTEDLTASGLRVASIYGTEDRVLNMEKYAGYRSNLPDALCETIIGGGCHACFGSYGAQDGDGTPTITAEEQLQITIDALMEFFSTERQE